MMIRVDGGDPVDITDFLTENAFEMWEVVLIVEAIAKGRPYLGGGGAAAIFLVEPASEPRVTPDDAGWIPARGDA